MWRHLRLLKRGGRAHDPSGVKGTAPGELAVLCPACPYPDINIPANWRSATKDSEFVPITFVSTPSIDILLGTSTTSVLALMPVSASNDGKYPATKRTLS
jgi:hypothetical protein